MTNEERKNKCVINGNLSRKTTLLVDSKGIIAGLH